MTTPTKPTPSRDDGKKPPPAGGPTAPSTSDDKAHKGPATGGYDDHSPDTTSRNEKGGYGTG